MPTGYIYIFLLYPGASVHTHLQHQMVITFGTEIRRFLTWHSKRCFEFHMELLWYVLHEASIRRVLEYTDSTAASIPIGPLAQE